MHPQGSPALATFERSMNARMASASCNSAAVNQASNDLALPFSDHACAGIVVLAGWLPIRWQSDPACQGLGDWQDLQLI